MNSMQGNDKFKSLLRVLHALPKLRADDTFELRLRQRLSRAAEMREPIPPEPVPVHAVPSFVYSSVALCLLVVLTYYLFTESGIVPNIPSPVIKEDQSQVRSLNTKTSVDEKIGMEQKSVNTRAIVARKSTEGTRSTVKTFPPEKPDNGADSRTMLSASSGATVTHPSGEKNPPGFADSESGLVIDQKNTTTGVLELRRADTTISSGSKNRTFVPNVRDKLGVGVLGQGLSSSLSDSLKTDSLKRIKKLLIMPKAIEKKPKE